MPRAPALAEGMLKRRGSIEPNCRNDAPYLRRSIVRGEPE
jgi:hypothetical protein